MRRSVVFHSVSDSPSLWMSRYVLAKCVAAVRGSLMRNQRQQLGDMDLLIAATALHHGLTFMTNNLRDFQHVPGLVFYQP